MDADRFWDLIERARTAAGPAADEAIRDVDFELGEIEDLSFDDIDIEALDGRLTRTGGPEEPTDVEALDDADLDADDEDLDEDDELDEEDLTDPVAVALFDLLVQLPPEEIAAFENAFEDFRTLADREDIAAAATLIEHGLLGDESFEDFRAGLVALGRQAFEAALDDPDSLADHPVVREIASASDLRYLSREDLLFVPSHAYAVSTGREELTFYEYAESLRSGEEVHPAESDAWEITDEAETRRRLPRLSDLFFDRSIAIRRAALAKLGLDS